LDKKFSPVSRSTISTETRKLFHPEPLTLLSLGIITAHASGVRHQCRTAPTRMRRARRRSIVKAVVLYTNWLAPGFNIDSRERKYSSIKVQTAFVKLSHQDCLCDRELTSTANNSYGTLAKTIKTINRSFLPPYNVYLTWLAMRLAH
jgi:hypothetical protein